MIFTIFLNCPLDHDDFGSEICYQINNYDSDEIVKFKKTFYYLKNIEITDAHWLVMKTRMEQNRESNFPS